MKKNLLPLLVFGGAIIALQEVRSSGEVTFLGDLAAFFGAVMVVGYLMIGREFRSRKLPLHLYAFDMGLALQSIR